MATLSLQSLSSAGAAPTLTAADVAGDSFPMISRDQVFHLKNASGGALRAVFVVQQRCNFGVLHSNLEVSVPAGQERFVSGLDPLQYGNGSARVQLTYPDGVTGLTVGSHT